MLLLIEFELKSVLLNLVGVFQTESGNSSGCSIGGGSSSISSNSIGGNSIGGSSIGGSGGSGSIDCSVGGSDRLEGLLEELEFKVLLFLFLLEFESSFLNFILEFQGLMSAIGGDSGTTLPEVVELLGLQVMLLVVMGKFQRFHVRFEFSFFGLHLDLVGVDRVDPLSVLQVSNLLLLEGKLLSIQLQVKSILSEFHLLLHGVQVVNNWGSSDSSVSGGSVGGGSVGGSSIGGCSVGGSSVGGSAIGSSSGGRSCGSSSIGGGRSCGSGGGRSSSGGGSSIGGSPIGGSGGSSSISISESL